jgi:hypothetical protein
VPECGRFWAVQRYFSLEQHDPEVGPASWTKVHVGSGIQSR